MNSIISKLRGKTLPEECRRGSGCIPGRPHGSCVGCGDHTGNRTISIETGSLRRRMSFVCIGCQSTRHSRWYREQQALRELRARGDWNKVSEPVAASSLQGGVMPEQYASRARAAIRAFVDSGFEVAMVPDSDVTTLQVSINSLGLTKSVYAEQRDGATVLRAISD